jgi:glycosyltransferase involved in cell wall biosynthesis
LLSKSKIIYIRLSQFHVFSIIALKLTGSKPVLELNGILEDDAISAAKSSWFRWLVKTQERLLIRQASAVIAVSDNIAKKATHLGTKNVFTIKNGVSENFYAVRQRPRNPDDALVVIYVGTFTPWDGAIYIPKLARLFPEIKFLMIGDGGDRKKVEAESPSNMEFVGYVEYSKLPKYLSQADAGIVLYEEERHKTVELSSLKTLEYMAAGLAIFTTDVPGQEFIAQNGIGKTVHFNNLEDEFRDFISNIDVYKKNAEVYRQTQGKKFGWNETARLTIEIINSLR